MRKKIFLTAMLVGLMPALVFAQERRATNTGEVNPRRRAANADHSAERRRHAAQDGQRQHGQWSPTATRVRHHMGEQNQQVRRAFDAGQISREEMSAYERKFNESKSLYQQVTADGTVNQQEEAQLTAQMNEMDQLVQRITHN